MSGLAVDAGSGAERSAHRTHARELAGPRLSIYSRYNRRALHACALLRAAQRVVAARSSEFNARDCANAAWGFVNLGHIDDAAMLAIARRVHDDLKRRYNVQWDAAGNIGRRYRRQDEIGTPLCITVDFDSIEDGCVTVRDRDSTDQVRVKVEDVAAHVVHVIEGL